MKSKQGAIGKKIADGAYSTMIERITSTQNPDLFVLSYSDRLTKICNVRIHSAIEDLGYNYYHKYSFLGSKDIFFRNNFHVERLAPDDLELLIANCFANSSLDELVDKTFSDVVFESRRKNACSFFGSNIPKQLVPHTNLVLGFAYEQIKMESVAQLLLAQVELAEYKKRKHRKKYSLRFSSFFGDRKRHWQFI